MTNFCGEYWNDVKNVHAWYNLHLKTPKVSTTQAYTCTSIDKLSSDQVKLNEPVTTIPTIGFNVETLTPIKGVTFTVWDVGGQEKIRALWRHYFAETDVSLRLTSWVSCQNVLKIDIEKFPIWCQCFYLNLTSLSCFSFNLSLKN